MPAKSKAPTAKTAKPVKKKPSRVENIMTNDVRIPIPPSNPTARKRASKTSKGFVETVKEDVLLAMKAVGKFVEKVGLDVPPPKRRNTKTDIVPPFTSPI